MKMQMFTAHLFVLIAIYKCQIDSELKIYKSRLFNSIILKKIYG